MASTNKERCDKLLSLITKKDREIEELEEKCLLIESRSRSLEHENDSLRLALRLVAQDRSGDDSHHSRHTKAGRNAHNDLKMSTVKTGVTRNRFESISEDASNEIRYPTNRGHSTTEVNRKDKKSKFNRTGKKNSKGTAPIPLHNTVDTEQNGINSEHREENNPSRTIIIAGDSILKHLNAHKMSKDNNKVKVATFPGCTIRDMHDHIKPILRKKPDQLIIHFGTNSLRESESPSACSDEIINLVSSIKRDATDTDVCSKIQWLSLKDILFGIFSCEDELYVNHILLLARQHLHSCRCNKKLPRIRVFIAKINMAYQLETMIAKSNVDRLPVHNSKWGKYVNILSV